MPPSAKISKDMIVGAAFEVATVVSIGYALLILKILLM